MFMKIKKKVQIMLKKIIEQKKYLSSSGEYYKFVYTVSTRYSLCIINFFFLIIEVMRELVPLVYLLHKIILWLHEQCRAEILIYSNFLKEHEYISYPLTNACIEKKASPIP